MVSDMALIAINPISVSVFLLRLGGWVNSLWIMCVCVRMCACVCAWARACVFVKDPRATWPTHILRRMLKILFLSR